MARQASRSCSIQADVQSDRRSRASAPGTSSNREPPRPGLPGVIDVDVRRACRCRRIPPPPDVRAYRGPYPRPGCHLPDELRVETGREVKHLRVGPRIVAEQSDQILHGDRRLSRAPGCRVRRALVDAAQDEIGRRSCRLRGSRQTRPDGYGTIRHARGTVGGTLRARDVVQTEATR